MNDLPGNKGLKNESCSKIDETHVGYYRNEAEKKHKNNNIVMNCNEMIYEKCD